MALLMRPCGSLMRQVRAQGFMKYPRTRAVLDKLGLLPIRDHYYEPYIRASSLRRDLSAPRPLPGLDLRVEAQLELLRSFKHQRELAAIPIEPPPSGYGYRNRNFGMVDAGLLYGMIRRLRPRHVLEVGGGMTTLLIRKALEDGGIGCEHVCIEPYEPVELDARSVRVWRCPVERTDPDEWVNFLEAGDLLFVDSSHVVKPQGDVLFIFQELLPRLRRGVWVHFHDIFTPRDYPERWLLKAKILWTEQYLLETYLCGHPEWEIVLAAHLLAEEHPEALAEAIPMLRTYPKGLLPNYPPVYPNSFYLRKIS